MPRIDPKRIKKIAPLAYGPPLALEAYAKTHTDRRVFELIKIRASAMNGCSYCLAMHHRDAAAHGETPERIAACTGDWRAAELWTPAERAALALTDEVTALGEAGVTDAVWAEAMQHWGEKAMVGLIMAICAINVWNRLSISIGLEADDL